MIFRAGSNKICITLSFPRRNAHDSGLMATRQFTKARKSKQMKCQKSSQNNILMKTHVLRSQILTLSDADEYKFPEAPTHNAVIGLSPFCNNPGLDAPV